MSTINDFLMISKIGTGSYSSVFKVKRKTDKEEYALKKVSMSLLKEKEKENALNEVRILASINHPNMIAYKEAFFDEKSNSLCIVMEFAKEGDLQKRIDENSRKNRCFHESEIWKIAFSVLRGLKQLHNRNIVHRDIKCANIFIKDKEYKLGDLNVSKMAKNGLLYTQTGTPYYAAPEVWRDEPYNSSSDIWSLGCMIYELAALKPPFRAPDMEGLYKKIQKGAFDRINTKYSNDLQKFLQLCLNSNAKKRPSCTELLNCTLMLRNISKSDDQSEVPCTESVKDDESTLLQTIKVPYNLRLLSNKLPKSNYGHLNRSFDEANSENLQSENLPPKPISKTPLQVATKHQKAQQQDLQRKRASTKRESSAQRILPELQKNNGAQQQQQQESKESTQYEPNRIRSGSNLPLISNNNKNNYHYSSPTEQAIGNVPPNIDIRSNRRKINSNQYQQNSLQLKDQILQKAISEYSRNRNQCAMQEEFYSQINSISPKIGSKHQLGLENNLGKANIQYHRPAWWG